MKKSAIRLILFLFGSMLMLTFSMCCSTNKLQGYEFREQTASALLAHPSPPEIFTDSWSNVDFNNPIEAVIGIGTGIAKEVQVAKTRAKMDSAMEKVDIPEIVRTEILERGSKVLHYRSTEDTGRSDFLFDMEIRRYGIDAKSWTAGVYFKMDVKITLLDNMKKREVWRSCFDERFPVSRDVFGLPEAAGNVITMVSLSRLTASQIADGLENLAVYTSDRVIQKLTRDFSRKNQ